MTMKTTSSDRSIEHKILESEVASTLATLADSNTASCNKAPSPCSTSAAVLVLTKGESNAPRFSSLKKTPQQSKEQQNYDQHNSTAPSSTNGAETCSPRHTNIGADVRNPMTIGKLIKDTVLRGLNKPQDKAKRNMFAIEGRSLKFPAKLMYLLDECKEFQNIVCWLPDGCSFVIRSPEEFEEEVLPVIFKEARFSSFLRKLTRWGFVKKCTTFGMNFSQKKFRRGNYSLCVEINCYSKPTANKFIQMSQSKCLSLESPYSSDIGFMSTDSSSAIICDNTKKIGQSQIPLQEGDLITSSFSPSEISVTNNTSTEAKIEQMRQFLETQAGRQNTPFSLKAPSPSLSTTSNIPFNESIQTGSVTDGYYELNNQDLTLHSIKRTIEEEQKRALEEIQRLSRESALLYHNHGVSLQNTDLARLIQERGQQLPLFGNNAYAGDTNIRNLTPQQEVLLSSTIHRSSDCFNQRQANDASSFFNHNNIQRGRFSNHSTFGMHLSDPTQALQERGRMHSQIMSAALEGLLSASTQDESTTSIGPISTSTANLPDMSFPPYDTNLLYQQQQLQRHILRSTNNVNGPTTLDSRVNNELLSKNALSRLEGRNGHQTTY